MTIENQQSACYVRTLAVLVLVVTSLASIDLATAVTDHGLEWGIDSGQSFSFRLIEILTNQTYGSLVMEDVLIFLKADALPQIPLNITAFSDVPIAWGSMLTQEGADFIPFLSTLDISPSLFVNSTHQRIALPIGNWSMMTQICTEYTLYRQSENSTHWSIYFGTIVFCVPFPSEMNEPIPLPTTPVPGLKYIKQNWTYHKENGALANAEGSWQTSEILLEYKMFEAEFSTSSTKTDANTSTSDGLFNQIQHLEGIVFLIGTTSGILLVLVIWRRKTQYPLRNSYHLLNF